MNIVQTDTHLHLLFDTLATCIGTCPYNVVSVQYKHVFFLLKKLKQLTVTVEASISEKTHSITLLEVSTRLSPVAVNSHTLTVYCTHYPVLFLHSEISFFLNWVSDPHCALVGIRQQKLMS